MCNFEITTLLSIVLPNETPFKMHYLFQLLQKNYSNKIQAAVN